MNKDTFTNIQLNETSLSRIYSGMNKYETGFVTGYQRENTYKENLSANQGLYAQLAVLGYQAIRVRGQWTYHLGKPDEANIKETSFFVLDHKETGQLKQHLAVLAKQYGQESVLHLKRGGEEGVLIGTRGEENDWPAFGEEEAIHTRGLGVDGEIKTIVNGRPITYQVGDLKADVLAAGFSNETKGQLYQLLNKGKKLNEKHNII